VQAWKELHEKYKNTIVETFQHVGLSLNPNSSEDHKIKIKGLDNIKVGNFIHQALDPESGFGSPTAVDIALVEAAQAKLVYRKVAKSVAIAGRKDIEDEGYESNEDDEDKHEVFTLGCMNTRSQTQVNRYYTSEELASPDNNTETIEVVGLGHYTNNTCDTDEEVDNEPPDYDPSDGDDEFDDAIEGDQDAADENMN
jgi:hypothetical protein